MKGALFRAKTSRTRPSSRRIQPRETPGPEPRSAMREASPSTLSALSSASLPRRRPVAIARDRSAACELLLLKVFMKPSYWPPDMWSYSMEDTWRDNGGVAFVGVGPVDPLEKISSRCKNMKIALRVT